MNEKPFKLGIIVGRFQNIHAGHEEMIEKALELCDRVAVFVGSSQESGTNKNPFSYELRRELLTRLFGDKILIYPLPDIGVGNNSRWGDYVLRNVEERVGMLPDLLISGKESRRIDWFDGVADLIIAELYIPKSIEISASQMREFFCGNDFESWKKYTNPKLWDLYDTLREIVLASRDNHITESI